MYTGCGWERNEIKPTFWNYVCSLHIREQGSSDLTRMPPWLVLVYAGDSKRPSEWPLRSSHHLPSLAVIPSHGALEQQTRGDREAVRSHWQLRPTGRNTPKVITAQLERLPWRTTHHFKWGFLPIGSRRKMQAEASTEIHTSYFSRRGNSGS